jgi:hypothetical protein
VAVAVAVALQTMALMVVQELLLFGTLYKTKERENG